MVGVEHSPHHPKVKGSNPVTAVGNRRKGKQWDNTFGAAIAAQW
jgi:hypothetical protein